MIKQLILTGLMLNTISLDGNNITITLEDTEARKQFINSYYDYGQYDSYYKGTNRTELNNYCQVNICEYSGYTNNRNGTDDMYDLSFVCVIQVRPTYSMENTYTGFRVELNFENYLTQTQYDISTKVFYTTDDTMEYMDSSQWTNREWIYYLPQNIDGTLQDYNIEINQNMTMEPGNIIAFTTDDDIFIARNQITTIFLTCTCRDMEYNLLQNSNDHYYLHTKRVLIDGDLIPNAPSIEVVDIPGLMFTILTMPFAFISQAFDLTLFPGTAYQINISQLFLGLIGVALLLWVLKIILGRADLGGLLEDANAKRQQLNSSNRARERELNKHNEAMDREAKRHERAMKYNETHHTNRIKEGNKK